MNKVILKGRLATDVDTRSTQSGSLVAKCTIAVNRNYKSRDTGEYQADFITLQAWKNNAEFLSKYVSKGQEILVEGTLQTGKYKDKNHSDVTHYTTDVVVERVEFCGKKSESGSSYSGPATPAPANNTGYDPSIGDLGDFEEILSDGDCPF